MKTKPKYFSFTINAKSEEELAARISDNESRGFELVATKEIECDGAYAENSSYIDADGVRRRYKVSATHRSYSALMRRENNELE